ncbi:hypothetical protein HK405_006223, partial [Cladochytrium tenue]
MLLDLPFPLLGSDYGDASGLGAAGLRFSLVLRYGTDSATSTTTDLPFVLVVTGPSSAYCIEAVCPHSGGPLHKGALLLPDLEDLRPPPPPTRSPPQPLDAPETVVVTAARRCPSTAADSAGDEPPPITLSCHAEPMIECPWHLFRYSLVTGRTDYDDELGRAARVYPVVVLGDSNFAVDVGNDKVTLLSFRPYDRSDRPASEPEPTEDIEADHSNGDVQTEHQPLTHSPPDGLPSPPPSGWPLEEWATRVLEEPEPRAKARLAELVKAEWDAGRIPDVGWPDDSPHRRAPPDRPPRPASLAVRAPGQMKRSSGGGSLEKRIVILHALANIELWAIDLGFDIIARFAARPVASPVGAGTGDAPSAATGPRLPREFAADFLALALEEVRHFGFLAARLEALGSAFGALPVHGSLGDSARDSRACVLDRLAIVHMVHEARGLDVNPGTIAKFERAGDAESVEKLTIIHNDEVGHVATGQRWFAWCCDQLGLQPHETFHAIVRRLFHGTLKA